MNILFLTLAEFESLEDRGIYTDLLREFVKREHDVYVVSPVSRRAGIYTHLVESNGWTILRLRIGNIQKTSIVEKGISTVLIEPMFKKAIGKYFADVKFDLVLYSTPPITLVGAVEYVKQRDGAQTYLILRDIFPQNAVDIGMMGRTGVKGFLYRHFRRQEKRLYRVSDYIGCLSDANVHYVLKQNPEVDPAILEICPNSVDPVDKSVSAMASADIREKYSIPLDKKVFVYGGNLGKPQDIPFVINCLRACKDFEDVFFLVVGSGTEYGVLSQYVGESKQNNLRLMSWLPKEDYDTLVGACDVGMIFLDHRFTIPNFPSRLLSYMQAKIPVLAVTDSNTDVRDALEDGGFGWWIESNDASRFAEMVQAACEDDLHEMGLKGWDYLLEHYTVASCADSILSKTRLHNGD